MDKLNINSVFEKIKWKIKERNNSGRKTIDLFWWKKLKNIGDAISPHLFEGILDCNVRAVGPDKSNKLLGCGSILHYAKNGDAVFGSGAMHQNINIVNKNINVFSVRGPLTRSLLVSQGVECPEVYGDPGILLPLIRPRNSHGKKWKIGVIPHYMEKRFVKVGDPSIKVICVKSNIDKFLADMWGCERVVSSSLHGIILAESYGIPADWFSMTDEVVGGGFKFRDYYLSTDRNPVYPLKYEQINKEREWTCPKYNIEGMVSAMKESFKQLASG